MSDATTMSDRELNRWLYEHLFNSLGKFVRDEYFGSYTTDLNAAHAMEERLREMGLDKMYAAMLWTLLLPASNDTFGLIHATARQRCEAAYEVLKNG